MSVHAPRGLTEAGFSHHLVDAGPRLSRSTTARRVGSASAGVNHLGAPSGTDVEVNREFMPAGQGAGAITELVPAAELVGRFVEEAEAALKRASTPV